MAYAPGNKYAKNCCKRTILFQLIVEDVVTCFLEHISVYSSLIHFQYIVACWCVVHQMQLSTTSRRSSSVFLLLAYLSSSNHFNSVHVLKYLK